MSKLASLGKQIATPHTLAEKDAGFSRKKQTSDQNRPSTAPLPSNRNASSGTEPRPAQPVKRHAAVEIRGVELTSYLGRLGGPNMSIDEMGTLSGILAGRTAEDCGALERVVSPFLQSEDETQQRIEIIIQLDAIAPERHPMIAPLEKALHGLPGLDRADVVAKLLTQKLDDATALKWAQNVAALIGATELPATMGSFAKDLVDLFAEAPRERLDLVQDLAFNLVENHVHPPDAVLVAIAAARTKIDTLPKGAESKERTQNLLCLASLPCVENGFDLVATHALMGAFLKVPLDEWEALATNALILSEALKNCSTLMRADTVYFLTRLQSPAARDSYVRFILDASAWNAPQSVRRKEGVSEVLLRVLAETKGHQINVRPAFDTLLKRQGLARYDVPTTQVDEMAFEVAILGGYAVSREAWPLPELELTAEMRSWPGLEACLDAVSDELTVEIKRASERFIDMLPLRLLGAADPDGEVRGSLEKERSAFIATIAASCKEAVQAWNAAHPGQPPVPTQLIVRCAERIAASEFESLTKSVRERTIQNYTSAHARLTRSERLEICQRVEQVLRRVIKMKAHVILLDSHVTLPTDPLQASTCATFTTLAKTFEFQRWLREPANVRRSLADFRPTVQQRELLSCLDDVALDRLEKAVATIQAGTTRQQARSHQKRVLKQENTQRQNLPGLRKLLENMEDRLRKDPTSRRLMADVARVRMKIAKLETTVH